MNILVIDVGTSSMRGIVYGETASELDKIQIPYSPVYYDENCVEQDASDWTFSLLRICTYYSKKNTRIDAIALTSQRSSVIALSECLKPLSPAIMWQDKRSIPLCNSLSKYDPLFIKRAGSRINPVYSASKMAWIRQNQPELFKKTAKLVVIPDYLALVMTGRLATDYTYGSRSLLMDIRRCRWDDELLAIWGIPKEKLCDLIAPGSMIGTISKEFSEKSGLKSGIPLFSCGGDQSCSALGQGVIHAGDTQITAGTGAYIISCCRLPDTPKGDVILSAGAIPESYVLECSILACCSAFNWFHKNFYPETDCDFSLINSDIASSLHGENNIIALPCFQGRATPDWNGRATASFHNLTLSSARGDLASALLEGICFEIKTNFECMRRYLPSPPSIVLSGGLTKCPSFPSILAGVLGIPVHVYRSPESTALGAYMSAGVSLGLFPSYECAFKAVRARDTFAQSEPENTESYNKKYSLYQDFYTRLYLSS